METKSAKKALKRVLKNTKYSYTFEKTVNWMSKNSAVCPKNVCVPASRKEVKKAFKRVKTLARRTYVPLTRKVTLTL